MELTPKQQASEAVRQAENILITTGAHPSIDQVTGVLALAMILRKLGKKVTALVSDQLPASVSFLPTSEIDKDLSGLRDFVIKLDLSKSEVDKLKYTIEDGKLNVHITPFKGGFSAADVTFGHGNYHYDLAIVLGVPTRARMDRVFTSNPDLLATVPVVNIDFHRSNENHGAVNLIDPYAASLSEMLVALSESLQTGLIDEPIATVMLTGIVASTDRFTASHTTAKSLTVAAQMMAAGAKQQEVVKALYRQVKSEQPKQNQPKPQAQPAPQEPKAEPTVEEMLPPSHIEPVMPQLQSESTNLPTTSDQPLTPYVEADLPNPGEAGYPAAFSVFES